MDIGVVLGLLVAFTSILASLLIDNCPLPAYLNFSASLIVFGGSVGATIATVSVGAVLSMPRLTLIAMFKQKGCDAVAFVERMAEYSKIVRREGMLALEPRLEQESDPFVRRALQLVIDGLDGGTVVQILESDIEALQLRHKTNINVFNLFGAYAPAMGILGTVLGLIAMLMGLGDTTEGLGQAVAVAFLTTLYGVMIANLFCFPVAANLKIKSDKEVKFRRVVVEGVLSLQNGENPSVMKEKLLATAGMKTPAPAETAEVAA